MGGSQVMPSLRSCMPNKNPNVTSVASLEQFYNSKKVVGVTALGIGQYVCDKPCYVIRGNIMISNLFLRRKFDYCIVDEASQLTLPACVGPLRYADVFVLVGDQYQLPPLVRSTSEFLLMSNRHNRCVITLLVTMDCKNLFLAFWQRHIRKLLHV